MVSPGCNNGCCIAVRWSIKSLWAEECWHRERRFLSLLPVMESSGEPDPRLPQPPFSTTTYSGSCNGNYMNTFRAEVNHKTPPYHFHPTFFKTLFAEPTFWLIPVWILYCRPQDVTIFYFLFNYSHYGLI